LGVVVAWLSALAVGAETLAAPAITNAPQGPTLLADSNTTLAVAASGSGHLGYAWLFNGFTLNSDPQLVWQVQVSTNLSAWSSLGTVTNAIGQMQFTDPAPPNAPARFYRGLPSP
jgi:hypothetical protein